MTRTKGRACTLFQALRCSKMGGKRYTVQGQAEWGTSYIKQSYGNPRNALNFHLTHDYYLAPPMPDGKKTDACTSIPGEVVKRLTPLHLGELACEADTSVNMPSLANIAELADPFTHAVRHAREQQPFGRATRLGQTVLNALE
ncbi:MAG TPA: hypothetical protein VMY99_01490 [Nevskiaceae bacterium]|nr:hypothetical protein [Nevskiaceae bacterium]